MVTFVKEFENYVLSENKEEFLLNVIPGSEADYYLQIMKQLKSIDDNTQTIPTELWNLLDKARGKFKDNALRDTNLLILLKEYDLPKTGNERKKEIIKEIKNLYFSHMLFDYVKPSNVQNVGIGSSANDSSVPEFTDKLDESIFDIGKLVEEYIKRPQDSNILQQIDKNYFIQTVDLSKMPETFFRQWLVNRTYDFHLSQMSDDHLKVLSHYVDKFSDNDRLSPDISHVLKNMTIEQIQKLADSDLISSKYYDKNELVYQIINKKYYSQLDSCENELDKRKIYLQIYNLIKDKPSKFNSMKANVLLEILQKGKDLNVFDIKLFKEYLAYPCTANEAIYKFKNVSQKNEISKQKRYRICGENITTDETGIIKAYLSHFFIFENVKVDEFEDLINYEYLNKEYQTSLVLKGEESDTIIKSLGKKNYEDLIKKTQISICGHNKNKFDIDELVKIEVDVKNIQTLFVKIFEINTENYYYSKKSPLNSNISLEGLITTNEETYSYNEKPQKLVRRVYEFDKIPKKRGIYIIEFIGGGFSSRAIIKKGGLSLVTRPTSRGQFLFILNENSEICRSERTGVWFKDNFYACDKQKGHIVVPFMRQTYTEPCIMVHENFADINTLTITDERYELKGAFHVNHESIITGNTAKILFKPLLQINGRVSKLKYLKNAKISANLIKLENDTSIPISNIFDNLKITNDKDIEIELQIPHKLMSIDLNFEAEVFNYSKEKNDKVNFSQRIDLLSSKEDSELAKLFLRKTKTGNETNFIVCLLGKNGEPKSNQLINFTFIQNKTKKNIKHNMQTNANGEVYLGSMRDVHTIIAQANYFNNNISNSWVLPKEAIFSYPDNIDILVNESIKLPYSGNNIDPIYENIIFDKITQKGETIQNRAEALKILAIDEDNSHFNIVINTLEQGNYLLYFKNLKKTIYINVHVGKIWETSNFIITKNSILENSEYIHPIHLESVKVNEDSLLIKVNSKLSSSRVHIFTNNFLNNDINYLTKSFSGIISSTLTKSENPFQIWKNIYLSNRVLNDEIQYVFDRKYLERYLGNSLEKPSLLVKRQFVTDTTTDEEQIEVGSEYKNLDVKVSLDKCVKNGKFDESKIILLQNNYSDFHNFLANSSYTLLNIKPNSDGEVVIKNFPFNKFSHLQIVCQDERSISEELIVLPYTNQIEKRNLALKYPLDVDKTYSEIRNTILYEVNQEILISDISSTSFKIIDSLEKAVNYQLLANSSIKNEWNNFSFLLKFSELPEDEQLKKFSKYYSHEMNVFLYFKYPSLFHKYVHPVIKFKFEKTFIDYFLLNDNNNILKYSKPDRIFDLNAFERCLLIYFLVNNKNEYNSSLATNIRNTMICMVDKNELNAEKLKRLFGIMMNMKVEGENPGVMPVHSSKFVALESAMYSRNVGWNQYNDKNCSDMEEFTNECYFEGMNDGEIYQEDKFNECERNYDGSPIINARNNLFKNAGTSKEYQETHYYDKSYIQPDLISVSNFWIDLATYFINNKNNSNFISKNILLPCQNNTELIFTLAVLDLPFASTSHQFNRQEGMSLQIIPSSNLVLFTKEIKEASCKLNTNLMLAQNIVEFNQDVNNDQQIKEFLSNKVYVHETIVTNISTRKIVSELLIQIPQGAVPVMNSEYTKTINFSLEKFHTTNFKTYFYFPDNTGVFIQYPPNAAIEGIVISKGEMLTYNVVRSLKTQFKESLDDILISGSKNDILEFLHKNNKLTSNDLSKVYWLLKDREFYSNLIEILRKKAIYDSSVWSFSLYHLDESALKEYLESDDNIKKVVGPKFNSSLLKVDETSNYDNMNHLDYHPIFNARVHRLGREANVTIMNKEFKETYENLIIYMLRLKNDQYDSKCLIRLCYYLILQDRIEDALKIFNKIKTLEFNENSSLLIQYDYIAAYLDFCVGYPEFDMAKKICLTYKNFPLLYWRDLFEEIEDQIFEYEGKEVICDIDSLIDEEKKKKQMVKNLITALPTLGFTIENKALQIQHSNIDQITIKFYLIDLEILFSRTPFIKSKTDDFSFVQPNYVSQIKLNLSTKQELITFRIPEEFISKNVFIEVSSINKKAFETYFSTSLKVTISENLGEIKIADNQLKPLPKVYVKCYASMNDGSIKFYKDGYTDLRGKFNYILLNTDQLKIVTKFAVFIMHDEFGSIIKECNPPSNIKRDSIASDYDNYQNYRQEVKKLWRSQNKI